MDDHFVVAWYKQIAVGKQYLVATSDSDLTAPEPNGRVTAKEMGVC